MTGLHYPFIQCWCEAI